MVPPIEKGVTMKKTWTMLYPNMLSAICPVPYGERLPILESPGIFFVDSDGDDENDEHQLHLHSEEQKPSTSRDPGFCPSITEIELNNLIRDLELPKNKAELLASRLQQWNLLDHYVKVTTSHT
jgi:hypothetical protein